MQFASMHAPGPRATRILNLRAALLHGSKRVDTSPTPTISTRDRDRARPTKLAHPVQDVAAEQRLGGLRLEVALGAGPR